MATTNDPALVAIRQAAAEQGVPYDVALAIAKHESGLNPKAVGDRGTSFGLYQLHKGGELGSHTAAWAFDPLNNARTALAEVAAVAKAHPDLSWGTIAVLAQRPAQSVRPAYTSAVDAATGGRTPSGKRLAPGAVGGTGIGGGFASLSSDGAGGFTTAGGTPASTSTGSQVNDPTERPKDWIGTLDALINPDLTHGSGFFDSISPANVGKDIGSAIQLVAARTGLALVGLTLFAGGLLLAVGPEVLGGAARRIPGAASVASTVDSKTTAVEAAEAAA